MQRLFVDIKFDTKCCRDSSIKLFKGMIYYLINIFVIN